MKKRRTLLFRLGAVLILLIIAGAMMVIGRGHTVYLDNKTMDYNGQTYHSFYKAVVYVDGEQIAKLRDKDRGMSTCIGQQFEMTLEITKEKGGSEETYQVSMALPYNMDGVAVNLPAFLAGLPEEAYLSEFVITAPETEEAGEEETIDEFGIGGDI